MYLDRFKLIRKPFNISSDPDFLWLGHCHGMALSALSRAVDKGGVMVLTGDVGTGKTTLLNAIVQGLPPRVRTVRILDPCIGLHQLFPVIARNLGIELQRDEPFDKAFVRFLGSVLQSKEHCLVIVDEAQRIGMRFLKALYSWQDLGNGRLPITVFLVGQNEFAGALSNLDGGRFLKKTTLHKVLVPLDREETADYVRYRMSNAGAAEEVFLEAALGMIFVFSKGYPRVINSLCDRCLVLAHRQGSSTVDEPLVQSAARQVLLPQEPVSFSPGEDETGASPVPARGLLPMVCALAVFLAPVLVPAPLFDDFSNSGLPEPGGDSVSVSKILPAPGFRGKAQAVVGEGGKPVESLRADPDDTTRSETISETIPVDDPQRDAPVPDDTPPFETVEEAAPVSEVPGPDDTHRFEIVEDADPVSEVPGPDDTHRFETVEDADPGREVPDPGDVITWLLERNGSGQ
ncbi:MAG: AAA family ATPase [Desulfobacteraceae bacterium]|nr:AAA family ATPase [Desulfobacteraceae bacterium]